MKMLRNLRFKGGERLKMYLIVTKSYVFKVAVKMNIISRMFAVQNYHFESKFTIFDNASKSVFQQFLFLFNSTKIHFDCK